jgi:hypothetical protein
MTDGYTLIRKSTLAWLLEIYRASENRPEIPEEVARDLRVQVTKDIRSPVSADRIRLAGPLLSAEEHETLLLAEGNLDLPTDKQAGAFWRLVVQVVHGVLRNEGEAALKLIGGEDEQ